MKNNILYLLFLLCFSATSFGQVGINTDKPNSKAGLHVSERKDPASTNADFYNGTILQRYTTAERDTNFAPTTTEDGLTIYNTTEKCYNFWNSEETTWKSVCGALGKATLACTATSVGGAYTQGVQLTSANYIAITVNVTKAGTYYITGTTTNGYNFTASGTFLQTGTYTVQVFGQGTPVAVGSNNVTLTINGASSTCAPVVTVLSSSGTYSMSCGSAIVNGVYTKGTALTASNTITLPVTVTTLGSWSITTNTVDGISFSGSGTFTSTGNQNVTLAGTGKPTSTTDKVMTISSNSADGVSTCTVTVVMTIPIKTVLHIGNETAYGYSAFTGPSRSLMDSPTNFGTSASSVVKSAGYTHISLGSSPSSAALLTALNNKPDIVIISYNANSSLNTTSAGYLTDYLNKKGVLIFYGDGIDNYGVQNVMRSVFSDSSITTNAVNTSGAVYALANTNDPILNGPFGDVRGKNWGEDASGTTRVVGISGSIIPFSYAQAINDPTVYSGVTGFRHTGLNLVYFGDGGFLSNEFANGNQYPSTTIEPFVAPSSGGYFPVQKTTYGYAGNGYSSGSMQVQNSIIFANTLAWAIKQAETSGINTK